MERQGAVTFKGNPLTLIGPEVKAGQAAPAFHLKAYEKRRDANHRQRHNQGQTNRDQRCAIVGYTGLPNPNQEI